MVPVLLPAKNIPQNPPQEYHRKNTPGKDRIPACEIQFRVFFAGCIREEQKQDDRDKQHQAGIVLKRGTHAAMQQLMQRPLRPAPRAFKPRQPIKMALGERHGGRVEGRIDINSQEGGNDDKYNAPLLYYRTHFRELKVCNFCEYAQRHQNDKNNHVNAADDKADGNPGLRRFVAGLRLIVQIGSDGVVRGNHGAVVQAVRFGGIDNGDNSADKAAEQRADNGPGHFVAMRRQNKGRPALRGQGSNLSLFHYIDRWLIICTS